MDGLCAGYAAEDGAALHFVGERLARVVSSRPKARAYRMRTVRGRVVRTALRTAYLGDVTAPLTAEVRGSALDSGPPQVSPPAASLAAAAGP